MKKKTQLLSLLLVLTMLLAFVPASAQAVDETPYDLRVLTFEDADYKGGANFAGGSDWTSLIDDPQYGGPLLYGSSGAGVTTESEAYKWTDENNTMLSHVFPYNYNAYCYWGGGHAISNYGTGDIADYGGFQTQLTVYKKGVSGLTRTGTGHNGSNNFAVHYGYIDGSAYNKTEVLPAFSFTDGVERVVDHMYITNTTYALNCYIDGNGLTAKIGDDDWVKVVAIGYDANGEKTGETGIYLCNGPDNIVMDWTKWDLSVLGKVHKVAFNVTGSSDNGYGFSQPAYFAYDDVAVRFEKPVSATGIKINSSKLELSVGETASLTATLTPANTTEAVVWTSSNDDVAAVENGTVTAKKAGSATIRATCGSVKAECAVTVTALPIAVSTGDTAAVVSKLGKMQYYAALPYGSTATIEVADAAFLLVSDAGSNYINEEGANPFTLTAAQLEDLFLTDVSSVPFAPAKYSKIAYMSIMNAAEGSTYDLYLEMTREAVAATGVMLDKNVLTLKPNETAKLTASVLPENTTDSLAWTTSDASIATVKDGAVTALKTGTATITAVCGSAKAECVVTVEAPTPVDGVKLSKNTITLFPDETAELTARVSPANATDKSITWESKNADVASVKNGIITARKAGETIITVKTTDGGFTAECRVTVKTAVEPKQESGIYQIGTPEELVWFAKKVNGGGNALSAVLTSDIDLSEINWTPIGGNTVKFGGTFDGAGHVIRNLSVDYATKASGERVYLGLFGCVEGTKDAHAVIKNFTVSGSVTAKSDYSVYGGNIAGVVADGKYLDLSGVVSRVAVNADENTGKACGVGGFAGVMVDCTVTDCGNEGNVSGVKNIGGFCYELYAGTMTGCYNTGSVTAAGTYVGGIMGYAKKATIQNVYNRGAVSTTKNMVGGLVGVMEASTVTNAYTTGTVAVVETGGTAVGAAIGWAGKVSNVYYLEGTAEKGIGRADDTSAATAEAKTADQMQALQGVLGGYFKADTSTVNGGYPVLQWQPGGVVEATLTSIHIAKAPTRTEYTEGESFDAAGMVVMAVYSDGNEKEISDYTIENGEALTAGMTSVTVKYGDFTAEQPVTVTKKDVKAEYTLTMPADKTVNAGEAVAVPVTLGHTADETTFHAADMVFTYDTDKLTYVSVDVPDSNCSVDAATAGTIHVQAYGEAKNLGKAFTLNFTVNASATGTATVTATSAKIDKSANAVAKDAPEAKLLDAETVLTIKAVHNVTLDPIFTGDLTVEDGADYTFSKTDKDESHYEYTDVKATVNDENVAVIDNGDGTYTVKNVTGDLTVTGKRTAKTYSVKVEGTGAEDVTAASSAIYGEDFKFTLDRKDGFRYTVAVNVGDKSVTPDTTDNLSYTIPGADVTGNIVITVTKDAIQVEKTTVNFEGSGAGDVNGGTFQDTPTGADFTFTVNEDAKYNYTVKLGDEVLTGTNGSYTIPGAKVVSGTITVTVEKTVSTQGVKVQKYVKLENQQSVWLVTVEADPGANNVYTYGGERMFKTTKYGTNGTYAYLVIAPTLSVEDAAAQLSITAGEAAGTVSYGGDVNGSAVVDINDAQLVYDMYNAHYASFSDVAMYKFLCADIADDTPEGSTLLNVSDAVAVISKINQQ